MTSTQPPSACDKVCSRIKHHFVQDFSADMDPIQRLSHFLLVLMPFTLIAGSAVADIVLSLTAILFLTHAVKTHYLSWLKIRWVQVALALWALVIVRGLFAEEASEALRRALPWVRYPIFAMAMAYWIAKDESLARRVWLSLSAAILFLLGDTFYQYFVGVDIFGRETYSTPQNTVRLTGPFSAPKAGVVAVWLMLPVLLPFLLGKPLWRGVALAFFALLVVFLTGERMAMILALFGFCLVGLLLPKLRKLLLPIGVGLVIVVAGLVMTNQQLMDRQIASTMNVLQNFSESDNGVLWERSGNIIEANPVFGVGLRHFRAFCPRPEFGPMDNLSFRCNLHPHHLYMEWAVEAGLLGLALFVAMLFFISREVLRHYSHWKHDAIFIALLVTFGMRIWPLATSVSFHVAWAAAPFWFIAGWLLSYSLKEKR